MVASSAVFTWSHLILGPNFHLYVNDFQALSSYVTLISITYTYLTFYLVLPFLCDMGISSKTCSKLITWDLPKLSPLVNFFLSYIFILLHDTTIHPVFQANHLRSTNTFLPPLNLYLLLLKYFLNEFKSFQLQSHCHILGPHYLPGALFQWSSNPFSILQL